MPAPNSTLQGLARMLSGMVQAGIPKKRRLLYQVSSRFATTGNGMGALTEHLQTENGKYQRTGGVPGSGWMESRIEGNNQHSVPALTSHGHGLLQPRHKVSGKIAQDIALAPQAAS